MRVLQKLSLNYSVYNFKTKTIQTKGKGRIDFIFYFSDLETVGKSDNSLDAGLVGVDDGHLGDRTARYCAFKEGVSMRDFHWNLDVIFNCTFRMAIS